MDEVKIQEVSDVWVAYTKTDYREGKGDAIPICHTKNRSTAARVGKGRSAQGTTDVRLQRMFKIEGSWYGPIHLTPPTREDEFVEMARETWEEALQAAKKAGLTPQQIAALGRG